jgi:hypothetical protein
MQAKEQTPVSFYFFHASNVAALHTSIRYRVYQQTGRVIDRQSTPELVNMMRAVHEDSLPPGPQNATRRGADTAAQVAALNERVLARAVPDIVGAVRSHAMYLSDVAAAVPLPLERAQYTGRRGIGARGTLELPTGF